MPKRQPVQFKGSDGKPFQLVFNNFKGGTMTLSDESRIPENAVYRSDNMYLDQDGVWTQRPGSQPYGQPLTGPIDGNGSAIKYNIDGTSNSYLFTMDNGQLKYCQDGGAWTTLGGKTWTTGYPVHMKQVKNRLYIANGKDSLSYVDLSTFTIVQYIALSAPGAPTLSRNVLITGNFTVYYQITAVSAIGETIASAEASITVNKRRNNWSLTTGESVGLAWAAVTNAQRYNIYYTDQTGQEVFLDSTTALAYTDSGTAQPNPYQQPPAFDGTSGPALARLCLSGNRIWGLGDPNNISRVSWTGVGQYLGSFNPYYGGGYIDLNLGSDEKPVDIQHYRDGKGNQMAVVLTSSPNGGGSTWFISLTTLNVDVISIVVPQAVSQGSIGTNSPFGVVQATNNIFYPSVKGFQSLGSAQTIFNVLVTTEVSANVRPSVRTINMRASSKICGIYFYGKIYWSVPSSSNLNNQIWVLDLERQAWCLAFSIGVKQFVEYADSSGAIHLLGVPVTGNSLIELSPNFQGDSGQPFSINLETGLIHFDKNHFMWAWVQKVYVELGRLRGNVQFNVSGTQTNKSLRFLKGRTIVADSALSSAGIGADSVGDFLVGDSNNAPNLTSSSSTKKVIYPNRTLNNLKLQLTSSDINAGFALLEFGIEGLMLPTGDPSSWRK